MFDKNLYQISQEAGKILLANKMQLVTAESCTGGLVAAAITAIAGSSSWFERGFVTYSNDAKMELLGVKKQTLQQFGAVSDETVCEMVQGALQNSHAQIALAITGIAGPSGGAIEKPVGTVYFGWMLLNQKPISICKKFSGERNSIQLQAAIFSLQQLVSLLNV